MLRHFADLGLAILAVAATLGGVLPFIGVDPLSLSDPLRRVLEAHSGVVASFLALASIASLAFARWTRSEMSHQLADRDERLRDKELEIENLEVLISNQSLRQLQDPVSGLPNKKAFSEMLSDRFARSIADWNESVGRSGRSPVDYRYMLGDDNIYYLVVLDIENFRMVNSSYQYSAGTKGIQKISAAIRAFATDVHEGMRRSEFLFRLGGDEFGFVIQDNEPGVVGFLNRLHQASVTTIADDLRNLLGDDRFSLNFRAGVTPILLKADADYLIDQGYRCCEAAKSNRYSMRVVWPSLVRVWGDELRRVPAAADADEVKARLWECTLADFEHQVARMHGALRAEMSAQLKTSIDRDRENLKLAVERFYVP